MDDWSLKGRLVSSRNTKDILVDAEVNKCIFGSTDEIEKERILNKEFGYTKRDIETLRYKLLEDLFQIMRQYVERNVLSYKGYPNIEPNPSIKMTVDEALFYVEESINKRFGIDD